MLSNEGTQFELLLLLFNDIYLEIWLLHFHSMLYIAANMFKCTLTDFFLFQFFPVSLVGVIDFVH